jgi:hypothetical protein
MPKTVEISAKLPKKEGVEGREADKVATISLKCFGENLDEDRQLVGDDVIKSNYESSIVITVQGGIRRLLEKGSDAAAVQAAYNDYKPGTAVRRGVDVVSGFKAWFASLTPDQQKEELKKLRESAA